MNILIYGIGGVGGYFGGKLANTKHHVSFIARGGHLKAIQEKGLFVKSFLGDFKATPDLATDRLTNIPTPDLILMGVKSWQLEQAAKELAPHISNGTLVLPLQNGVNNPEKLMTSIPEDQILNGFCNLISFIEAPGIICHQAFRPTLSMGELDNQRTDRIERIHAVFLEAGVESKIPEDIHREQWKKFMFITTISAIGGLTRSTIGEMRSSPYLYQMMRDTAFEILKVAQAKHINIARDDVDKVFEIIAKQDPQSTASTQRDLMHGKPSELENFNGYIVEQAKKHGIQAPVNELILACLLPMERRARAGLKS
ncbi:2-dehydropantoate 2-reductase [Galbibacter sp. PAP.153]|uniref:ketopantoate reductase family protein n=1 Tax=Galbibacter sp. PAP.153 TaxID=3104623 RepID=UPI00300839EA